MGVRLQSLLVCAAVAVGGCGDPEARVGTPTPEEETASPTAIDETPTWPPTPSEAESPSPSEASPTPETPTWSPAPSPTEAPTPSAWPVTTADLLQTRWEGEYFNGVDNVEVVKVYNGTTGGADYRRTTHQGDYVGVVVAQYWWIERPGEIHYHDLRREGEPLGSGAESVEPDCLIFPTEPRSLRCGESVFTFYQVQ